MKNIYIAPSEFSKQYKLPTKGSDTAHCFDIFVGEDIQILPNEIKKVPTNFKMQLPKECAALIRERSSTITKYDINVEAGDIDSDYRGHVWVVLYRKPAVSLIDAIRYAISNTSGNTRHEAYVRLVEKEGANVSCITQVLRDMYFAYIPGLWRTVNVITKTWSYWWRRNKIIKFAKHTRLAQMEIVEVVPAKFEEKAILTSTHRGSGGFGSTGQTTIKKSKERNKQPKATKKTKKVIRKTEDVPTTPPIKE